MIEEGSSMKRQTEERKNFCSTPASYLWDNQAKLPEIIFDHHNLPLMKKTLIVSLCTAAFALSASAQDPATATSPATSPAVTAPADTAASPAAVAPADTTGTSPATATSPAAEGVPATNPAVPAAPGTAPTAAPASSVAATIAPDGPAPATSESPKSKNFFIDNFRAGGPIMWPILLVSIIALTVVIERVFWWGFRWFRRDPKRIEKVFTAIETGDVNEASRLARGTRDPVLRMLWNGLNHQHASLQGALQVAAGIEIKRAGRFLVVMDTLVTLAPLLGLLGTITGLMKSFGSLGNEELAVQAVTGGIAEALIATACGLGLAIFCLIPFNFFTSRVSNLEFELQTAATNLEVMLEANAKAKREAEMSTTDRQ
jgi:biopolymer transport protein ExbB